MVVALKVSADLPTGLPAYSRGAFVWLAAAAKENWANKENSGATDACHVLCHCIATVIQLQMPT